MGVFALWLAGGRMHVRFPRLILQRALDRTGGVQTTAAELLRMTFRQFRYKLQKHSLAKRGAPGDE